MFGVNAERIAAFVQKPLENPLSRSEQMELARLFLHIKEQIDSFNSLPERPISDVHVQMVIDSHEKGWATIVSCKISYELAKEVKELRGSKNDGSETI
ncbi:hypothetical protein FRN98_24370 [Escherichia coli]|nr:hypothetical protein [Escherichia coli]EJQ5562165.1 hypothetical protein [Escherichia coli]ELW7705867.1 hypothetical protein [Escherichia coli]